MVLAACALLSAGCSSSNEHVVFTVATGFSNSATARTTDLVDIGLAPLHKLSDQRVTLRRVSLVPTPRLVHIRMVVGYLRKQVQIWTVGYGLGNYVKHWRRQMTPYRLPSIVTAAHSDSRWFLVLSLRFDKPGRYYLRPGEDRLHRRRAERLAVPKPVPDDDHHLAQQEAEEVLRVLLREQAPTRAFEGGQLVDRPSLVFATRRGGPIERTEDWRS